MGIHVHRIDVPPGAPPRRSYADGPHSTPERQPLGQNGLAACKPRTGAGPATGGVPLPPAAAVGAATRTQAPADAPAPTARPSCGFQLVELHHSSDLAFLKKSAQRVSCVTCGVLSDAMDATDAIRHAVASGAVSPTLPPADPSSWRRPPAGADPAAPPAWPGPG